MLLTPSTEERLFILIMSKVIKNRNIFIDFGGLMEQYEKELMKRGIAIGLGLLLFDLIFVYFILYRLLNIGVLLFSVCLLLPYYLAGQYCGRRWQNTSWKWGFWFIIPLIVLQMLFYILRYINPELRKVSGFGDVMLIGIGFDFVLFLTGSLGAIAGAKASQQTIQNGVQRRIAQIVKTIMFFTSFEFVSFIIIRGVFLAIITFVLSLIASWFFSPLIIANIFIYLYCSYKYGKHWSQPSWVLGMWLILPWFFFTYIMFGSHHQGGGDTLAYFQIFITLGFIYLIFACIGAYVGARAAKQKETKNA